MNRKTNKFHRDIRDINEIEPVDKVEFSPEAQQLLDKMNKIMLMTISSDKRKVTIYDETNTKNKGDKV